MKHRAIIPFAIASGCGAVGSALDWGSRGREFKSRHSDQKREMDICPSLFFIPRGGWKPLNHLILHLRCKITASVATYFLP